MQFKENNSVNIQFTEVMYPSLLQKEFFNEQNTGG